MKLTVILVALCTIAALSVCNAYRVLGVFPFNGKSHNIVFDALMKALAAHGHQVDVVTHFPLKKPVKNLNVIVNLDGSMETVVNNYTMEFVNQINADMVDIIGGYYGNRICHFMGQEKMQNLIKNPPRDPPYDLLITEAFGANCYMGLGYVFNVPVIAVSSSIEYPWVSHFVGNNENLAVIRNALQDGFGEMTFWERVQNVYSNLISVYKFHALTDESQTDSMRKYLKPDMPNIREVEKNVALTFVNSNAILFGVKPLLPTLIQIAGIHIYGNNENLTPELQKWMDESTHGVVYFTFGSMVLIETLTTTQLTAIYSSFKKIAPIRVLMKVVDKSKLPPGLPENIKILPWLPQQPILAHPNTRIFITHGGLGGLQEALYYGVPLIGMPLFADQFRNLNAFIAKGMVYLINLKELSESLLDSALQALIHNPVYKEKAVYYSKIFKDQPINPVDNAVYWTEYIIRNGGDVLRPSSIKLSWWQLALLDVYGLALLVFILSLLVVIFIIRLMFKRLKVMLGSNVQKKKKTH